MVTTCTQIFQQLFKPVFSAVVKEVIRSIMMMRRSTLKGIMGDKLYKVPQNPRNLFGDYLRKGNYRLGFCTIMFLITKPLLFSDLTISSWLL